MLKQIVYASSAVGPMNNGSLKEILITSREWNREHHISGLLIYFDGTFVQVLEGNPDEVDFIYSKIIADTRHKNVTKLLDETIEEREFQKWEMAFHHVTKKDIADIPELVDLNELEFGELVRNDGAKDILKSFYELHINTDS